MSQFQASALTAVAATAAAGSATTSNDGESGPGTKKQPRAKHACRECNARRIRCNVTECHPCSNCRTTKAACEVVPSRRGRYPRRSRLQKQLEVATKEALAMNSRDLDSMAAIKVSPVSPDQNTLHDVRLFRTQQASATPATSTDLTPPTSTGNLFFGESNFLTLVPGPSPPATGTPTAPDGPRKSRLSFAIPSTPQSQDANMSPARMAPCSAAKERYLHDEGALSFPDFHSCLPALRAYFEWFHPCFPILDRSEIAAKVAAREISPILLNAILFIGATYCDEETILAMGFRDRSEAKSLLYSRTRLLFHADWERDQITLIQALFLASFWRGGPSDVRDVRYWLGVVITLAESHGLHRATRFTTRNSHVARMRKRIWWSIYVRERQSAASLGLPSRIRDADCDIEPLTAADLSEDEDNSPETMFGRCTSEHVTYVIKMVETARLLGRIIDLHFVPGRAPAAVEMVQDLAAALENWKQGLPDSMKEGPEGGQTSVWTCLLHLAYNHLRILIHRNGFLRNMEEGDKGEAMSAACRISRIAEDMLTQRTLQYGQMHLITSLFAALCIHTISIKGADGVARRISEHRAQMCLLGLKEIQQYWRINNNVLDLFLEYLDESIARRLHGEPGTEDVSERDSESIGDVSVGRQVSAPYGSSLAHPPPLGQTVDVFEDQYLHFLHATWEGDDAVGAVGDLGLYLNPQLYANGIPGPVHPDGLAFLERSL